MMRAAVSSGLSFLPGPAEDVMEAPILLVDDNPDDVLFLERAFGAAGVMAPLRVAKDGAGAIDYLIGEGMYSDRSAHPLPALVLLDLKMPGASGFVVLRWLREQPVLKRLPVVMLTSSAQEEDIAQAFDLGVNSYIVKPSGLKQLNDVAKQIEAYWLSLNQRPPISSIAEEHCGSLRLQ
jgi:CheY-like chemotaxis protein